MPATTTSTPPGVIEHGGMLWKPKRGATASFEEFGTARETFKEITTDARWNPWVREDRQDEYDRAVEVMDQWRRAEPGHRTLTTKQIEARWARQDRQREEARTKLKRQREARKAHYDGQRAEARLSLFEHQSAVQHEELEVAGYLEGTKFQKVDGAQRREKIEALRKSLESHRREIDRLKPIVGDPETVIDQNGWLPQERRETMLLYYRFDREKKVRKLRTEMPELAATTERNDRWKVDSLRRELDALLAIPPLGADDMCSDCPTPISQHGWTTPPSTGPCPAWPRWRARVQKAWQILEAGVRETESDKSGPQPPKPEPLATIPSGLPIAEVTQRLYDLQKQFPDAEVRRGRANRWELWPSKPKG